MLEIKLDGYNVDYGDVKDLRLAFTYSIADINSINDRSTQGSRSYEITLPATNNNKKIFGFIEEANSNNGFNQSVSKECEVYADGSLVIKGTARIKGVVKADGIDEYKIIILGDSATWINDIKDLSLTTLDFSDENHTFNVTNIRASQTYSSSRSYIYPFINYGQWTGDDSYDYGAWLNSTDYKLPALRLRPILDKIFNAQGYTIKSDFLDTEYFNKLIMPYTAKNFDEILDPSFRDDRLFRAGVSNRGSLLSYAVNPTSTKHYIQLDNDTNTSLGWFDTPNIFNTANYEYTVDTASIQEFVLNIDITPYQKYDIKIAIEREKTNGVKEDLVSINPKFGTFNINGVNTFINNALLFPTNIKTGFIPFSAGDKVRAYIQVFTNETSTSGSTRPVYLDTTKNLIYFYNNVQLSNAPNSTLELNSYLPDRTQLDFVKGVRDLFNLYILTDINKKIVYIEPRDTFFKSTALDWTDKVDLNKPIETSFLGGNMSKEVRVQFADDSNDAYLEKYLDENESAFASYDVSINNVSAREGTQSKSNPFFAPTWMQNCTQMGIVDMKIPTLINDLEDPEYSTAFEPRVLYYNPEDYTFSSVVLYTIFKADFVNTSTSNTNSLSYSDDVNTNGLYQRYFRNVYNTINTSRIEKVQMYLRPVDVENIDFRTPIVLNINGEATYYHLNKVLNYNPLGNGLTKVELLKVVNPIPLATITEFTGTLPPDSTPDEPTPVQAIINGVIVDVKANLNGTYKQVYK